MHELLVEDLTVNRDMLYTSRATINRLLRSTVPKAYLRHIMRMGGHVYVWGGAIIQIINTE